MAEDSEHPRRTRADYDEDRQCLQTVTRASVTSSIAAIISSIAAIIAAITAVVVTILKI
jgi:hypothetical protein